MNPIRVAIVGCGRISDLHQIGYRERDNACIVAVCDSKKARAKQKAKAWSVEKVYTDFHQVLEDPQIDLVELLTPHHFHCPMTVEACHAGKHVSVQKPMALSAAEADKMINAADRSGVMLRVYENFVYYAPAVRAREMIEAGGQPRLDGQTGKDVLQFTLAALQSAATGQEVRPAEVL
jgi:predicted dehydrogenase